MIAIAIDGPAGAGKSTIARRVARELSFIYVDTGALYRAIGLFVCRQGKDPGREEDVVGCLENISVRLGYDGEKGQRIYLGEEDVSEEIRRPEISMAASAVSAIPQVRAFLLDLQRDLAGSHNVIMDGRDIGTVVLPDAQVKIFLTADSRERARRRYLELQEKGQRPDYDTVLRELEERDYNDSHRAAAPLRQAPDAILLDTTHLDFEASAALVINTVKERLEHVL